MTKNNQNNISGVIDCPTCKTSGYISETYVTISEFNKQKEEHEKIVDNLLSDLRYSRDRISKLSFWNNNQNIIGWIITAVIIISIAFAISTHEYESDPPLTIGDKIANCSNKPDSKICPCISSFLSEIAVKEQRDALEKTVESCYQALGD